MGARERRRELDHLAQLLDLLRRPVRRAGAVGHRQVELRLDRARRQGDGLLQLADRGRRRRSASAPRRGSCAHRRSPGASRTASRSAAMPAASSPDLDQHQPEIVVRLGEVRAQPDRLAERRGTSLLSAPLRPSSSPSSVVRLRARRGSGGDAPAGAPAIAASQSGVGQRRRRHVQPGLELPERLARARRRAER